MKFKIRILLAYYYSRVYNTTAMKKEKYIHDRRIFFIVLFFLVLNWPILSIPEPGGVFYFVLYLLMIWLFMIIALYGFSRHMFSSQRKR